MQSRFGTQDLLNSSIWLLSECKKEHAESCWARTTFRITRTTFRIKMLFVNVVFMNWDTAVKKICFQFTNKLLESPKFRPWLPSFRGETGRTLRNANHLSIPRVRTERHANSPIPYMVRQWNQEASKVWVLLSGHFISAAIHVVAFVYMCIIC